MIVQNMYLPDSNYSQRSQRCLSIAAAKRPSTFDNTNLFNIDNYRSLDNVHLSISLLSMYYQ